MEQQHDPINANLARRLLHYFGNDADAEPAFGLDYSSIADYSDGAEVVNMALKFNTKISWFAFSYDGIAIDPSSVSGILHFIANNPALRVLEIDTEAGRDDGETVRPGLGELRVKILKAAAENQNIRKLVVGNYNGPQSSLPSLGDTKFHTHLQELHLWGCHHILLNAWPDHHSLRTLKLTGQLLTTEEQKEEFESFCSLFLAMLAVLPGSKSIQTLEIDKCTWISNLPAFLLSNNTSIETLVIQRIDFQVSQMNALIESLSGSRTTKNLVLDYRYIEHRGNELHTSELKSVLDSLVQSTASIEELSLMSCALLEAVDYQSLFDCESLRSLCITGPDVDTNIESIKYGLATCDLASIELQTDCLAEIGPSLKNAISFHSLRSLSLYESDLAGENLKFLISLIKDVGCQMSDLSIHIEAPTEDTCAAIRAVSKALEGEVPLSSLSLRASWLERDDIVRILTESLGKFKGLSRLHVDSGPMSSTTASAFEQALRSNWSLQSIVVGAFCGLDLGAPGAHVTPALQGKIDAYMYRNQVNHSILAASSLLSAADKKAWLDKMATFWEMQDGFTLAFTLLDRMPVSFF